MAKASSHVIYIVGDEPSSRLQQLSAATDDILGNEDRTLALETFDLADTSTDEERTKVIEDAVYSLSSPPFLTSMRVVVIRDIGAATTDNVQSLITYLENPAPTSYLVAVQGGGRISTSLTKAWKAVVDQRGNARENATDVLARKAKELTLTFEPGVREEILKHCGEDSGKLVSMLDRLHNVFGPGSKLSHSDVAKYLGESGNVAMYELANEITSSNVARALDIVSRMMHSTSGASAKPMHPLQIVSLIANHFRKLSLLDDPSIRNQADAHSALGGKGNPFGAKKCWEQARRLGSPTIAACIETIGATDVIVKGANAIDGEIAIELLVISLCNLCEQSDVNTAKVRNAYVNALYI
jgi:DNA polymerase III delta subunit